MRQFVNVTILIILNLCSPIVISNKLAQERRNLYCCSRKLRCCETSLPKFEVRAHLFDRSDMCSASQKTSNCKQNLQISIKIINEGVTVDKNQYIIIEHVLSSEYNAKIKLVRPLVVKIRQQLVQYYGLRLEKMVNSEVKEVVAEGCGADQCAPLEYQGQNVPFSDGFCCWCNETSRQPPKIDQEPFGDLHQGQCPEHLSLARPYKGNYDHQHYGFIGPGPLLVKYLPLTFLKRSDKSVNYRPFKRMSDSKYHQKYRFSPESRPSRGAQSCGQAESTSHCLQFSKNWYQVFGIREAKLRHNITVQIFEKFERAHEQPQWKCLTKSLNIGNTNTGPSSEQFVSVTYTSKSTDEDDYSLNPTTQKLLIPENDCSPGEYLVLPSELVAKDGATCNTAGVGYEAFFNQEDRCAKEAGSCLANQPNDFRASDLQSEENGDEGQFFLKNYGVLPDRPLEKTAEGDVTGLTLFYTKTHMSILDFNIQAIQLSLVLPGDYATITEVYVEATYPEKTTITAKITNSGLVSSTFYLSLNECPLGVPASLNNIVSKAVQIPPQRQHIFHMTLDCSLPISEFRCNLNVFNYEQKLLAVRRIRFQKSDRCICIWHCRCACYDVDKGLKCEPLSLKSYHLAGFQGGMPITTKIIQISYFDHLFTTFSYIFMFFVFFCILMGFMKAVVGMFNNKVRDWGLQTIFGTTSVNEKLTKGAMFCLNFLFLFLYPLTLINHVFNGLLFPHYTNETTNTKMYQHYCVKEKRSSSCDSDICRCPQTK